jgi:hypothetical protein
VLNYLSTQIAFPFLFYLLSFEILQSDEMINERMPYSVMLRHVALMGTDVSEERIVSIIRVTRIGERRTMLAATSNRRAFLVTANVVPSSPILTNLMMEAIRSSETSQTA